MGINRYSNLSQAKFNPMSFQELSVLPFTQRKQHDAASAQAEQAAIIESQRMAADEEAVSGAINSYQAKVDDYINRLDSEGFSNTTKSDIRDLVRERKDLMSPTGIVGRKQAQYDRYVANMKQLDKDRDKISPYKYQALQNKAVEDYNNAVKNDPNASYQDVLAVKDYDYQKEARQIAKDVQDNPRILTQFGFTPIQGAPGQYWNSKTQTKYTGEGDISNTIQSILGQNQDVQADLYQRKELGLLGDSTPQDYLKSVGDSFNSYGVYQQTKSRSGFTNQMELDAAKRKIDESNNPNVPYSFKPAESFKIQQESFLNKISKIDGTNVSEPNKSLYQYNVGLKHRTHPYSTKDLNESEKQKFDSLSTKLMNMVNPLTDQPYLQSDATDIEKAQVLSEYLNKYKDVPYQNPLIEPNSSIGKLSSSFLLNTKDINSTNRNIINKINDGRMKLWDEKGNPISLDDLPDKYKVEYTGYIGPTNLLPVFKNADPSQSVAPHTIQIKDKDGNFVSTAYGSRNEFERDTPEFRAYSRIKSSINVNMSEPGLPETFDVTTDPKLGKMLSKYESSYDPIKKTYTLKLYDREGNLKEENYNMPENKLQDKWHLIYKLLD